MQRMKKMILLCWIKVPVNLPMTNYMDSSEQNDVLVDLYESFSDFLKSQRATMSM